jgi:bifunctional polynucleotide phosphatase/kinase
MMSENESVLIYKTKKSLSTKKSKIAGFDLDDTLVTRSLFVMSNVVNKLKELTNDRYNIVIISNQKKRSIGDEKLLIKLKNIEKLLEVPFIAICARLEDENRKPNNGSLSLIPEKYGKMEFFVGDAAGRKGDHSNCDKLFAENSNIPFYTPEEYFKAPDKLFKAIVKPKKELSMINGLSLSDDIQILTLIILTGYPASGKSFYTNNILSDYVRVNRDTLKTIPKCIKMCRENLQNNKSVVIDNLNNTKESRKIFIDLANECGARCVSIHINTSMETSMTWNSEKEIKVPKIVYYTYRKKFELPEKEEGFDELYSVSMEE